MAIQTWPFDLLIYHELPMKNMMIVQSKLMLLIAIGDMSSVRPLMAEAPDGCPSAFRNAPLRAKHGRNSGELHGWKPLQDMASLDMIGSFCET